MGKPTGRTPRVQRLAILALSTSAAILPGTAWAQCVASGSNVTCTGSSAPYTNSASGVNVTISSGATMSAPLTIGSNGTLANAGTISGTSAIPTVNYGNYANITNTGSIIASDAVSGAAGILVGTNSTVTNSGTLTAAAGLPAVQFGTNGTFIDSATTTAAITGNIVFGNNVGSGQVATFTNNDATYGLTGNVTAGGNINATNNGLFTGDFIQTAVNNSQVNFTNGSMGTFTGIIATGDQSAVINNGTMTLYSGSVINSTLVGTSSFANNGNLTVGTTTAPAQLTINGSFTQSSTGVLNLSIMPSGSLTTAAGTTYSQIYAAGAAGNVTLGGTLNLNVGAGFYPTGTIYKVILADGTITGSFASAPTINSGAALPFITFQSLGVQTSGTQQAYEFQVVRNGTYASVLSANGVTDTNELNVAKGLQPLVALASANTSGNEAALIGDFDVLTLAQAQTFLDSISPLGYYAYATALRDQANAFTRQIDLRLGDQNSDHAEDGWWLTTQDEHDFSSNTGYNSKSNIFGFTGGYDLSGPHHVYGLAMNISWNSLTYAGGYAPGAMTGKNRDIAFAAYAGFNLGPLHLTGQLAYNLGHLSTTKTITAGANTLTATAASGEHLFKATGQAGFDLKAGGVILEPFVGFDLAKGAISGFTESGANAADLTVSSINADRTDLLAGVSLTRAAGKLRPYLRATYRSQIGNGGSNLITAYFDGDTTDPSFTVAGTQAPRHEFDVNAGINFVFDDAGSLFIGYQGTMRSGYSSHGVNLGIRIEF